MKKADAHKHTNVHSRDIRRFFHRHRVSFILFVQLRKSSVNWVDILHDFGLDDGEKRMTRCWEKRQGKKGKFGGLFVWISSFFLLVVSAFWMIYFYLDFLRPFDEDSLFSMPSFNVSFIVICFISHIYNRFVFLLVFQFFFFSISLLKLEPHSRLVYLKNSFSNSQSLLIVSLPKKSSWRDTYQ